MFTKTGGNRVHDTATFAGVRPTIGYVLIAILALMFMVVIRLGYYLAGKLLGVKK